MIRAMHRELIRLIAGQVFLHASMTGLRLAAPLHALHQDRSKAEVGLLVACFALSQLVLAIPAGRLSDRLGLKRPLAVSVALAVAAAAAAAFRPGFGLLCASAVCAGASACMALIAVNRHAGRMGSNLVEIRQAYSWVSLAPALSNFLGPLLAGVMIDQAGFRGAFMVLAALPLAGWLMFAPLRERPLPAPAAQAAHGVFAHLCDPRFRRLLFVNWLVSSCWDVHNFVVPILGHERGLSASAIGSLLGCFAASAAAVRSLLPMLARHLREHVVLTSLLGGVSLLLIAYPHAPGWWTMAICSSLIGGLLGCGQPMIMSTMTQITPPHRHGEVIGLRLTVVNGSSVALPLFFGLVGGVIGISGLLWLSGAVVGIGLRSAWRMRLM